MFDVVLCNANYEGDLGATARWVRADETSLRDQRVYAADLIDPEHPWRHDSAKLAAVLLDLFYERTGPLSD
jgi:hypothetical protein